MASAQTVVQGVFDRFFSDFLVPLVRGGPITIGDPIAPGVLPAFEGAVPSRGSDAAELLVGRQAIAADVLPDPIPATLTSDDIRVGAAIHNLLYRTHPDAERFSARGARRRAAEWARSYLEEAREPEGRGELLERHTLVWPVFRTARVDTVLYNWAYRYPVYGRPPPESFLYRMAGPVRREQVETPFSELRFDEEGMALLALLMRRSALTSLLTPARALPPFTWDHDMVVALRDEAVCRAVTYAHVEQGLARVAGPLGFAFDQAAVAGGLSVEDLKFLACFYYNLLLTLSQSAPYTPSGGVLHPRLAREIEGVSRQTSCKTLFAVQLSMLQHLDLGIAPPLPLAEADRAPILAALGKAARSDPEAFERVDSVVANVLGGPSGDRGLPSGAAAG